jgi:hypothetical protein
MAGYRADHQRVAFDQGDRTAAELDKLPEPFKGHAQDAHEARLLRCGGRDVEHEVGRGQRPIGARFADVGHDPVDDWSLGLGIGLSHP